MAVMPLVPETKMADVSKLITREPIGQQSTATLCNHSHPCYTFSVRLFPASNTEISSKHRKKQTTNMGEDKFLLIYIIKIL